MLNKLKYFYIIISSGVILLTGCLKDNITPPLVLDFENAAGLIHYLESKGDYINSENIPSVVDAQEVYTNINNFLIIDIRQSDEYLNGHIESSINLSHKELLPQLKNIDFNSYEKIIIVSRNGQSSAYYTSLLRLYGFTNIYSMNYGMAAWHQDFAGDWINAIQSIPLDGLVDIDYPKDSLYKLPLVTFDNPSATPEEKVNERIIKLLDEDFYEFYESTFEEGPSISRDILYSKDIFVVCYGDRTLYSSTLAGIRHPVGAVYYSPPTVFGDFRSTRYLQALQPDMRIVIYSCRGNLSAFTTAYLRVLGYNASSIIFGANSLFYFGLLSSPLEDLVFTTRSIMNFPYVK